MKPLNKIDLNLKGPVKTCSESYYIPCYIASTGKLLKKKFTTRKVYYFDRNGKIIETHNFLDHGINSGVIHLRNIEYYKYNSKGKLIEIKDYSPAEKKEGGFRSNDEEPLLIYNDDGDFELNGFRDITSKTIYFYNSKGYIVKELYYMEESMLPEKKYYNYDEKNNLISFRRFDYKGLTLRSVSKYDDNGNLLNKKLLSPVSNSKRESLDREETYKYDNQGRLIEKTLKNYNGREKKTYKYHDNIREIEVSTFEWRDYMNDDLNGCFYKNILISILVYGYTISGEVFEIKEFNSDAVFSKRTVYKYDDNGNIIEKSYYDTDGNLNYKTIINKKYSDFDNEGNWRQSYFTNVNGPYEIFERELEYY